MKTRFAFLVSLGLLLFPFISEAKTAAPALQASLTEVDRAGQPIANSPPVTLTLNKRGAREVSFTFTQGFPCPPGAMCILALPITHEFRIVGSTPAGCGSRRIHAMSASGFLTVWDHAGRLCDDYQPNQWVVNWRLGRGNRRFVGNPKPVGPSRDCAEISRNTICTMQYQPATCRADTLGGDLLKDPLTSTGSNPCMASGNLRVAACERGLDWEQLREEEIVCATRPLCPVYLCAAPPEGCFYQPIQELDENGCTIGCGKLVCGIP